MNADALKTIRSILDEPATKGEVVAASQTVLIELVTLTEVLANRGLVTDNEIQAARMKCTAAVDQEIAKATEMAADQLDEDTREDVKHILESLNRSER